MNDVYVNERRMAEQEWIHSTIIFEPLLSQALGHKNEKGTAPCSQSSLLSGETGKGTKFQECWLRVGSGVRLPKLRLLFAT